MKRYNQLTEGFESMDAENLLKSYLNIKAKPFLDPEDMKTIKTILPYMYKAGIDVESLNIGEYKKDPIKYISKLKKGRVGLDYKTGGKRSGHR